jgi:hypothetical protein
MAILVRCNASETAPGNGFFSGEFAVEEQARLAEGDDVFIWTFEGPRKGPDGKGLELRGHLISYRRSGSSTKFNIEVRIADRLPETRLNMNRLADLGRKSKSAHDLYERIHISRHGRIWVLSEGERKLLSDVFDKEKREEDDEILSEIDRVQKDATIDKTIRKALVDARLGQGKFRDKLELRWDSGCAVTGCRILAVLRASHIKPWNTSSNSERLDPANGILLAAHLDALFDRGLISFENDGRMLVSKQIDAEAAQLFQLPTNLRMKLSTDERRFLAHHRDVVFTPA